MSSVEEVKEKGEIEESNAPESAATEANVATTTSHTNTAPEANAVEEVAAAAEDPSSSRSRSSSASGNGNGKRERSDDYTGGTSNNNNSNNEDEEEESAYESATKQLKSSDDSDNTGGDGVAGGLLSGRSSASVEDPPTIAAAATTGSTATTTVTTSAVETEATSSATEPHPATVPTTSVPEEAEPVAAATDHTPDIVTTTAAVETASVDASVPSEPPQVPTNTAVTTTDPRVSSSAPAAAAVLPAVTTVTAPAVNVSSTNSGGVDPNVAATIRHPEQIVEETGVVSASYVGRVIGKGGEMIRDLQARSGARIDVDQNVPIGQPRVITYRGTRETVDFAKHLVAMLSTDGISDTDLPLGNAAQEYLIIPASSVGKVIGRGGEMIRELQSRSQAKIQIDHSGQSGIPADQKQVTITGTHEAVVKGKEMVLLLVANPLMDALVSLNMLIDDKVRGGSQWGSGPPYMNLPNQGMNMQPHMAPPQQYPGMTPQPQGYGMYGQPPMGVGGALPMSHGNPMMTGGYPQQPPQSFGASSMGGGVGFQQPQTMYMGDGRESELLFVSKQFMGRIIGSKGVTINDLQRRSQCDIQINQDVPPGKDCEITVKGARQGIEMAKAMIQEIIEVGPQHPYAGGMENFGTKNVGGYHGGSYGSQHHQQPPQQYNPYQQQPQPPVYDQGAAYGQAAYAPQGNTGYAAPMMGVPTYGQPIPQPQQAMPYQQQPQPTPYGGVGGGYAPMPQQQQQQLPMATAAIPRPVPPQPPVAAASLWKSAASPDGQIYYYNERTGETQWEKPPGMP